MRSEQELCGPVVHAVLVDGEHEVDRHQVSVEDSREVHVEAGLKNALGHGLLRLRREDEPGLELEHGVGREQVVDHGERLRQLEEMS